MAAKEFVGQFLLYQNRDCYATFDCYGPDGVTPLQLQSADEVEARLWQTDGSAADLVVTESSTPSVVVVDNLGDSSTPARVTVKFAADDVGDLDADEEYDFELSVKDDSDSDKHKVICRGVALVEGSPSD